jgi:hypothetical protein
VNSDRSKIDLDKWLRTRVKVLNDAGGRGFDTGVRTFNCPLCRDTKGRGWANVAYWTAGCFNIGCMACERLAGGALELACRLERIPMRGQAFEFLREKYGTERVIAFKPVVRESEDFVRWPEGMHPLARRDAADVMDPMRRTYLKFVEKQWGISEADAAQWGLGYCTSGYYAQRVIIPIVMFGEPVAFQARTIVAEGVKHKKYITSRHGSKDDPKAECARSAAEILYNYDRIPEGGDVVLVEGVGDVMGWHRGNPAREPIASALLGLSLTPEKLELLSKRRPARVILAPDAEVTTRQSRGVMRDLRSKLDAWDFNVLIGEWQGGKDAGSGATLVFP